jgi:O-methyltransferase involved in polyketide biosynthesis
LIRHIKTKIKVEPRNVQKTLFMTIWARAVETKKDKPVLIDKPPVEIIVSVDFDFSQMAENVPEISQIAWISIIHSGLMASD